MGSPEKCEVRGVAAIYALGANIGQRRRRGSASRKVRPGGVAGFPEVARDRRLALHRVGADASRLRRGKSCHRVALGEPVCGRLFELRLGRFNPSNSGTEFFNGTSAVTLNPSAIPCRGRRNGLHLQRLGEPLRDRQCIEIFRARGLESALIQEKRWRGRVPSERPAGVLNRFGGFVAPKEPDCEI